MNRNIHSHSTADPSVLLRRCLDAVPPELDDLLAQVPAVAGGRMLAVAETHEAFARLRQQSELFEDAMDIAETAEAPSDLDDAMGMLREGAALMPVSKLARRMKAEIRRITEQRMPLVIRLHRDRVLADENRNAPKCPRCQLALQLRRNRAEKTLFWGCSAYPRCRGTLSYLGAQVD